MPPPVEKKAKKSSRALEVSVEPEEKVRVSRRRRVIRTKEQQELLADGKLVPSEEIESIRLLAGIRQSSRKTLTTMFGQRSGTIIDLLELDNKDGALSMISKTLLQTLVDVLPVIERSVRRSQGKRGVVPMNQTISQIREMCHDIQAYKDKSNMGLLLVERYIRPSYLDIAVQITAAFAEVESNSRSKMSKEEFEEFRENTIHLMKRNIASYMKQQYDSVSESIVKSLG